MINDDLHSKFGTKLWINHDWLKKLGLEMPRTTEELYQVLKAFKTKDPNGNGKADEIPLSGYNAVSTPDSNVFASGFMYPVPSFGAENYGITIEKGTVDFGFNKPGFRDVLRYARKLHVEGLFDPSSFTQDQNQLTQLGEKPDAVVLGAGLVGFWSQMTINGGASGRYKLYSLAPPLKGPKGFGQVSYTKNNMRRDTMVITSAAKQPEIIMKWIDYFFSTEGSRNIAYGPKDLGWRDGKPGEIGLNGKPALFDRLNVAGDSAVAKNLAWGFFPFPRNQNVDERLGEVRSNDYYDPVKIMTRLTGEVRKQYAGTEVPDEMYFPPVYMTPEQAKESITIRTNLMSFVKESSALFILGDKDIEKDWGKYVEEIEKIGVKRYVQIFQDAYNSQYKK
jgi:putative aldouronate transport system substrate-binding protein